MNHIAQMCANLIRSFEAMSGAAAYGELKFGPFELSSRERVLRRDGVVLPLGDRALDILIYLAERPGEVVAKRELMDHVRMSPSRRGASGCTYPRSAKRLVTANLATDTSQTSRDGATRSSAPSFLSQAVRRAGTTGPDSQAGCPHNRAG